MRAYLSPIILPTNEGWLGTAFWGTAEAILDAGIPKAGVVSSVVSASLGMSFTVTTADEFDMDFGRKRLVDRTADLGQIRSYDASDSHKTYQTH